MLKRSVFFSGVALWLILTTVLPVAASADYQTTTWTSLGRLVDQLVAKIQQGQAPLTLWEEFCLQSAEPGDDLNGCLDRQPPPSRTNRDRLHELSIALNSAVNGETPSEWEKFCLATQKPVDLDNCLNGYGY